MTTTCGCRKGRKSQLRSSGFPQNDVLDVRASCAELTRSELDLALMGQLMAGMNTDQMVQTSSRHTEKARERASCLYFHQGNAVCEKMFLFFNGIGRRRLKNLKHSLRSSGLASRPHGNLKCTPAHALSFSSTEFVIRFVLNYTEQNGLLLPGRVPGYSRSDVKLLPSSVSKRMIWRVYQKAAEDDNSVHTVAYTTFCCLWQCLLPSVIIMRPMTDLCWQCQKNNSAIQKSVNIAETEKSDNLLEALEHLRIVKVERSCYTSSCEECSRSVRSHFTIESVFAPPPPACRIPANSKDIRVHYSFDYAQQVHFPSDPMQPGPIYFLTPRKCSIFGVNCETLPRQVNFLTDESGEVGRGANAVISRLHFFFEEHGLGEKHVYLHADNCTGQNKKNAVVEYLMWRVLTGRHSNITYSLLLVGHTKFSPDWCFSLFKRLFKRTRVSSMGEIADVVEKSAVCNVAQVVHTEDSEVVPTRDWTTFLAPHFKKIVGIKKYHHFRYSSTSPGTVFSKHHADTAEVPLVLSRDEWHPDPEELPPRIEARGLNEDRQWYLFEKIRPFCSAEHQDTVAPQPSIPNPKRRRTRAPEE